MKHTRYFLVFLILCLTSISSALSAQPVQRPKLVIGIVVDQMRWDYLYRYYPLYQQGGFKRLLKEGFQCENTYINYLPSYTAVGHSTIFTGSVPAIDGITGNDWIDQITGDHWYCTEDTSQTTVGSKSKAGEMSPHNLLVSTITDELRLATNFQSRVVGVSLKDRASILPAGHTANAAFWFDDASGNFITSSYYMNTLPQWVDAFNRKKEPESLTRNNWNTLLPLSKYTQSTPDEEPWEGTYPGEKAPIFPHQISQLVKENKEAIRITPFGNTLTLNFAEAAIEGYHLGNGPATDFLTINCASTDYVGHMFGPNSIEIEDVYLRLDKDLASFFSFLDHAVGKGNYLVFLTADHGVAHTADFMHAHHLPAGLFNVAAMQKSLNKQLEGKFGVGGLVNSVMNYHVNFDRKKIAENHLDLDSISKFTAKVLQQEPGISFAVDMNQIGNASVPEPIKSMIINGYYAKRTSPVIIIPNPGWYEGGHIGTTHGNWNPYDTHIPLIFMGWHIAHGHTNQLVKMTDIAPTLAALLHIQAPNGCIGKVITELTHYPETK